MPASAGLTLGGCQPLSDKGWVKSIIGLGETINYKVQRALLGSDTLAPEFAEADICRRSSSQTARSIRRTNDYKALAAKEFADFKLASAGWSTGPQN